MQLYDFQALGEAEIFNAWETVRNVLAVYPTGSGKTVIFTDIMRQEKGVPVAIAHRQELVTQISLALARHDVPHRIEAPKDIVKLAVSLHMREVGRNYYEPSCPASVAGIDTLVRRSDALRRWGESVTLWVQDEAHHLLKANKWGRGVDMFPNARGLGVTATPCRADGKGLGRHADGVFDRMIVGPSMRELINRGYLTDYQIYAPPNDLNLTDINLDKEGDFTRKGAARAVQRSRVMGDVVEHYLRLAWGKLGVTFAPDVETATDIAARFNAAGVPAAVITGETPISERVRVLDKFKRREFLQLVSVDIFGEGFDMPAIEVVSMARPTQSLGVFMQQFGRALRIMDGKLHALIIDHVGNVLRHGLPDAPRVWTLDRRDSRNRGTPDDVIPVRSCPNCVRVYERIYKACPYCDYEPVPDGRNSPQFVDGDLIQLDAATLAAMRGEIDIIDTDIETYRAELKNKRMPHLGVMANVKRRHSAQEMQGALRASIAFWAGVHRERGASDSEIYRRFYFAFNIDILTAQALKTKEASALAEKINYSLGKL